MAKQVIKNDGEKVAFDSKKIIRSITKAAQDAQLTPSEMNNVVNEVSVIALQFAGSKDKIMASEIKEKILMELDRVAPNVSKEWRKFMNAKRK